MPCCSVLCLVPGFMDSVRLDDPDLGGPLALADILTDLDLLLAFAARVFSFAPCAIRLPYTSRLHGRFPRLESWLVFPDPSMKERTHARRSPESGF